MKHRDRSGGAAYDAGESDGDGRRVASQGRPTERTTGYAARVIGEALGRSIGPGTVRRWIDKGLLGGSRVGDSWYRTTDRAIEAFIEANKRNTVDTS